MINVALAAAAFFGLLFVLTAFLALLLQATYAERIYPGVRALGTSIGGQTRDEARAMLEPRAIEMSGRSIVVGYQELRWTVTGQHLGVVADVGPIVDAAFALGRDGNLFSRFFAQLGLMMGRGSDDVPSAVYDRAALATFMQALAGAVDRPVADARLVINPGGTVGFTEASAGRRLRVEPTQQRLEQAIVLPEVHEVELVVEETAPMVRSEDLAAVRGEAERLLSGPLVLRFEEFERQLTTQQLAALARIERDHVSLDLDGLKTWVGRLAKDIDQLPRNARFTWRNGALSVLRPSQDGRQLEVDRTVELLMARALDAERVIALPVAVAKPEVSQEDGPKLGIKGVIEVGQTSFAGSSPPKQHNINLAAERLNGVVVPPGKLFSFNHEVGSTSIDAGFKMGWGIANAGDNVKTVPSVAGGICQVATTLFHAVFWAGYQIEERNYHLYWIPGYTSKGVEGLDATVDEEAGLDFRFYNNTENYLLVQSWTEGARLVFGLYGTKPDWTVKVTPGERTDVVEASKDQMIEDEPTLPAGQRLAVEGAMDGFKVVNVRTVTLGNDVRTLRLASVYRPSRNVTLVGTGGRPAGPSQTITNRATRPAEATPSTRATPSATAQPGATPAAPANTPAAKPAAPATSAPAPTAAPASTPAPAPKPVIQPGRQPLPTRAPAAPTSGPSTRTS